MTKKNAKLELSRYLKEAIRLKRSLNEKESRELHFNSRTLNRCAIREGYDSFSDFKLKNNIESKAINKKVYLDDIIDSYKNFYKEYNKFPTVEDCSKCDYLYSRSVTNRVLKQNNMVLSDLCDLISGGVENKYTIFISRDVSKYEEYKQKYIDICNSIGKPISIKDFKNYNIPSHTWFIEHCPNKDIKGYIDFYKWCGFKNENDITKDESMGIIYNMQLNLDRPLMYDDFRSPTKDTIGISIVRKYWGTMNKMKKELGLEIVQEDMVSKHIEDIKLIINEIKNVCDLVHSNENREVIMTTDITKYNKLNLSIQSFNKICKQNNTTVRKIVESYGYKYQKEGTGMVIYYDDGEVTKSSLEYLFTNKLRELGYEYNINYFRDVRYRTFVNNYDGLLDCDYEIHIGNKVLYIEIAGMLRDYKWKYKNPELISSKSKKRYAEKLNEKENMFIKDELNYFILFPSDLKEENLDNLFKDILHINKINNTKEGLIMSNIEKNMVRERALKLTPVTDEMYNKCNKETRNMIQEFFDAKSTLSPDTREQYKSALRQFVYWIYSSCADKPLYKIKKRDFTRYMSYLVNRGMSSSGLKFKKSACSSLCGYILDNIVDDEDMEEYSTFRNFTTAFKDIPLNYVYEKIPISEEEYEKLKEVLLDDENYMALAWVVCAYNCGARRGGIRQFKVECIKDGIPEGKTYVLSNKVREKGRSSDGKICQYMLNAECIEYINLWLSHRDYESEYIFTTKYHDEIHMCGRQWVNELCTNILSDILGRRINPHLFKASAITHYLSEGKDMKVVSKYIAQHNSIETTSKFYDLRPIDGVDDLFD